MSQEKLAQLAQDAEDVRINHPFSVTSYHKLKEYASENSLLDTAQFLRMQFFYESAGVYSIEKWEQAIEAEYSGESVASHKSAMYKSIVSEFPRVEYFSRWIDQGCCSLSDLKEAFMKTKYNFHDGQVVFQHFLNEVRAQTNHLSVKALYEARLMTPHRQIQETYDEFSAFISQNFSEDYTAIMRGASKIMQSTQRSQRYYEMLEQNISADIDSPEPWIKYMEQLFAYSPKTEPFPAFLTIFYRSLFAGTKFKTGDPSWLPVWLQAASYVQESVGIDESYRASFFGLFLKLYPKSPRVYTDVVYFATSTSDIRDLRQRAIYEGIFQDKGFDHVTMAKDLLTLQWMTSGLQSGEGWTVMWADIDTTQKSFSNSHEILRLCAKIVESSNHEGASTQIERMSRIHLEENPTSGAAWLATFEVLESNSLTRELIKLVSDAMSKISEFDDLQFIQAILARYDTLHRLRISLENMQAVKKTTQSISDNYRIVEKELLLRAEQKQNDPSTISSKTRHLEDPDMLDTHSRKKAKSGVPEKSEADSQEPVRSREQFRVKLFPLNDNVGEAAIRAFLKGYAEPVSIALVEADRNVGRFAMIELHSEQEVLSCLTRQFKSLDGTPVEISRVFGTTVWAANYPSHYNIGEIQRMIEKISGKTPIEIRLPSQRDNKERRFCYADFADEATASFVRDKLAGHTVDGHEIQADTSNPTLKKPRDIIPVTRQVHLHNLNFKKTNEAALKSYFQKFGGVISVHLPLSETNKEKKYINNGFAFISFASDSAASSALDSKTAEIDDRTINISAVKSRAALEKKPSAFDDQRSVTLQNINEKVTEAQLRRFVETQIGAVSQISLKPSKKMALVEFEKPQDAGKAGFALEGSEYEDLILHVGSRKDFFQEEKTTKVPSMVPPMLMRRRKK